MSTFSPSMMLSFDLETTSPDPTTARIVTSALVTIRGKEVFKEELLADPGIDIPEAATAVHGITTEYAREHGRPHDEVLAYTINKIRKAWDEGMTLIVYNAPFDLTVLHQLSGDFLVTGPVFDPLVVDRGTDRYRKGHRNLGAVCEHYGVALENAHEATSDALAAARIAWKLVKKYPKLAEMDMDDLMVQQSMWYADYTNRLKEWFISQGKDTSSIDSAWPMKS